MKKYCSLLLIMSLMLSLLLPLPVAYAADDISGSLIFDLDLSGYDNASLDKAKGIKDSASDSVTEDLTLHSGAVVETFLAGSAIKALKLKRTTQGGIKALDSGVDAAASSNAMTVETWMKIDNSTQNAGMGHALLYTTESNAHNWQIIPSVTTDSNTKITSLTVTDKIHNSVKADHKNVTFDQWAHYVFTREYNNTAETCTLTLYVNGVQADRQTLANVSAPQTVSGGIMHIGGGMFNNSANYAIDGSIAKFKIYSSAMTQAQALAKYNAEKDSYVSHLIGIESVSPAGGTEEEPVEISLESGQIEINFNNFVKPEDLSKITFTKADNSPANNVNIDFEENNTKKVIVSYGEQEELTKFVLKIDSSLSSTYNKPLGTTYTYYYKTPERVPPEILSVTPEGGASQGGATPISPISGTITIEMDSPIKKTTLSDITFEKASGGNAGFVDVDFAANSDKKIEVTYSQLEELTDYILTIGSNLSSTYNKPLGEEKIYYYRTTEKPSLTFLDIDFESDEYVVGEKPRGDDGLLYWSTSGVLNNSTDNFLIRQAGNGDKYMTFDVSASNVSSQLLYDLPEVLNGRSVAFEIGVRGYTKNSNSSFGSGSRDTLQISGVKDDGTSALALFSINSSTSTNSLSSTDKTGTTFTVKPAEDGFNHIKVIISRDEDGYYLYDVYDKANSTDGYVRIKPKSPYAHKQISRIRFGSMWPTSADQLNRDGVAISYIKGYYVEHPRMIASSSDEINSATKSVKLYFDKEMDEESVKNGTYTLTDTFGKSDISVSVASYNAAENYVTLAFSDYLIPGVDYTLKAQGVSDTNGIPLAATDSMQLSVSEAEASGDIVSFADDGSHAITGLRDLGTEPAEINISYTMSNTSEVDRKIIVFAQHFDKD